MTSSINDIDQSSLDTYTKRRFAGNRLFCVQQKPTLYICLFYIKIEVLSKKKS